MADRGKLSLLSKNHTVMEIEVAMEIRKWCNLLDPPERTGWSLGEMTQSQSHL